MDEIDEVIEDFSKIMDKGFDNGDAREILRLVELRKARKALEEISDRIADMSNRGINVMHL